MGRWIRQLVAGEPIEVSAEIIDALNAGHAEGAASATKEEVVNHLQECGDGFASLIRSLPDADLDRGDGRVRRFALIAIRHADDHGAEIETGLQSTVPHDRESSGRVISEDASLSPPPIPGAVRIARILLGVENAAWLLLGTLLIVGGVIVLSGGIGIPGIVHIDDPGFAPGIGQLTLGAGAVIAVMAAWGLWTGWSMRRLTRGAYISALLFCAVWIVLGLVWVSIATTPIPGAVTITLNAVILVGLGAPSSSRAAFRGSTETGNDRLR